MKSFAHRIIHLVLFTGLVVTFQNCGKIATDTAVSGDMTQHIALDLPDLQNAIKTDYTSILGRLPTQAEIDQAVAQIQAGLSSDQFKQQLAGSAEAIAAVTNVLVQALGPSASSLTSSINYFISQMEAGAVTLAQLKQMFGY